MDRRSTANTIYCEESRCRSPGEKQGSFTNEADSQRSGRKDRRFSPRVRDSDKIECTEGAEWVIEVG